MFSQLSEENTFWVRLRQLEKSFILGCFWGKNIRVLHVVDTIGIRPLPIFWGRVQHSAHFGSLCAG
jgi:hypothetical protein